MIPDELTQGQYDTVYNLFSLVIAAQLFTALFLIIVQPRVLARYRQALVISAVVCGIAAYHYFRIFSSFTDAFTTEAVGGKGIYTQAIGASFNEGYRYVDWFLTVPLLLVETIAVLALTRAAAKPLLTKLVLASAFMIALGYPGEVSTDTGTRLIWGTLSTIPFLYILYVLFVEINSSLVRQPAEVRSTLRKLTIMLVGLWGVYPIAYLMPVLGFDGPQAFVLRQAGYSIADILAKAAFGLVIFKIARMKSMADEPGFDDHDFDAPLESGTPAQSRG
mgnify:CR=1 FL=1